MSTNPRRVGIGRILKTIGTVIGNVYAPGSFQIGMALFDEVKREFENFSETTSGREDVTFGQLLDEIEKRPVTGWDDLIEEGRKQAAERVAIAEGLNRLQPTQPREEPDPPSNINDI